MAPEMERPVIHWGAGEVLQNGKVLLRAQSGRLHVAEAWGSTATTAGRSWTPRAMTRN